jgi:uncharacterized membrane-anchored protein YjiN (DUF445 family)
MGSMSLTDLPPDDPRRTGLRRMRTLATLLLVAMTALFAATWVVSPALPGLGYVRAFAEAGMVGACADWFAVVALFRHPFGIPIPHTAIVPRNQARIAEAMGRFISSNFLTPDVLSRRLSTFDAARLASDWLSDPASAQRVGRVVATAIPTIVQALPREQLADLFGRAVRRGLQSTPAAPVAAGLLSIAWAQGQTQQLIESGLAWLEGALLANRDTIRQKVEAGSARWMPRWIDGIVADKIMTAAQATLAEMRDPGHPWRLELKASVESLIARLDSDPALRARAEQVKADILASPLFHAQVEALWAELEKRLPDDVSAHGARIEQAVTQTLLAAGRWLEEDPERKARINRWLRYLLRRVIAPRRAEIGAFVSTVVARWDARTLVNRMELQVGRDLQFIRINGTLVGGLAGLLIYAVTRALTGS